MTLRTLAVAGTAVLALAACSSPAEPAATETSAATTTQAATTTEVTTEAPPTTQAAPTQTAMEIIKAITEGQDVTEYVQITEENDPNKELGRPNQYTDAALAYLAGIECDRDLSIDCGLKIELWPTQESATKRAQYMQTLRTGGIMGTEYTYVRADGALLRIIGEVTPTKAKEMAAKFGGQEVTEGL